MICNKCNIEMEYYKPSDGPYYVCVKCNKIDYPLEDIDRIVDRGRD